MRHRPRPDRRCRPAQRRSAFRLPIRATIRRSGAATSCSIDLWAKRDVPRAVYSDLTRVGFVGDSVPDEYAQIFQIVARARDAAISRVREAFAQRPSFARLGG